MTLKPTGVGRIVQPELEHLVGVIGHVVSDGGLVTPRVPGRLLPGCLQMAQANIPIVPILRAMGVQDRQMREAWGNDLTAANLAKDDPQAINKAYAKLVRNGDPQADPMTKRQAVAEAFAKMELDPEVTARTLDKGYTHLTPDAYLAVTRKLLAVARGEAEPDDRDALANQQVLGPEDLFAERMRHARNWASAM